MIDILAIVALCEAAESGRVHAEADMPDGPVHEDSVYPGGMAGPEVPIGHAPD